MQADSSEYCGGTVDSYDARAGYGYIRRDEPEFDDELLLVHSRSLRDPTAGVPRAGDRVIFTVREVPRGLLATDVHLDPAAISDDADVDEPCEGTVALVTSRGFGFIRASDDRKVFFHISAITPATNVLPPVGTHVQYRLVETERGLQARDLTVQAAAEQQPAPPPPSRHDAQIARESRDVAARALLAREQRDYDEATRLYERGLVDCPTVQLVLSYAAMEKGRNRHASAMKVYERGIEAFPDNAKLYEDAGVCAASLELYDKAIDYLERSLDVCRTTGQAGLKGALLALGRTHYKIGTLASLESCVQYYEQALAAFERGRRPPEQDLLSLSIARIRTQHHRGNLTYEFLQNVGLRIVKARLLEVTTTGADIVVRVEDTELNETYGIAGQLLIRCLFKASVGDRDLKAIDERMQDFGRNHLLDQQVVLLVLGSLPRGLQRALFNRLENRPHDGPAFIPITQAELETPGDAKDILRSVLDRWLYRRDLFAFSFPVVGRRFFGRDKALAELREAVATATPAGVFGLRKVGKTSILKEMERRASESGDLIVYLDLLRVPADVSDVRWLYWKLATSLREKCSRSKFRDVPWSLGGVFRDFLAIPQDFPVATAFDTDMSHLLKAINESPLQPKPKVVFLLDEIERLFPTRLGKSGFAGFFDFFSYLRGLSQESTDFVLIITGANAAIAEVSQFDGRDNPMFNYFKEVYLQLLEPEECELMVRTLGRGMGIRFPQPAVEVLYKLTGGHPFFMRQLCSYIAGRYRERPMEVTSDHIEAIVEPFLDVSGKDYAEILDRLTRDYPEERAVCEFLAQHDGVLSSEELRARCAHGRSVRHLLGYQIVRMEEGQVSLTMALMKKWLQRLGAA